MDISLEQIKDWPALAKSVHYNATELAITWRVSMRKLERCFQTTLGSTPYRLLRKLRMQRAIQLIAEHRPVKEIADELCYKYPEHFARDFKDYFGASPRQYRLTAPSPENIRLRVLSVFVGLLQIMEEAIGGWTVFPVS